jgi:hypothetical protein
MSSHRSQQVCRRAADGVRTISFDLVERTRSAGKSPLYVRVPYITVSTGRLVPERIIRMTHKIFEGTKFVVALNIRNYGIRMYLGTASDNDETRLLKFV